MLILLKFRILNELCPGTLLHTIANSLRIGKVPRERMKSQLIKRTMSRMKTFKLWEVRTCNCFPVGSMRSMFRWRRLWRRNSVIPPWKHWRMTLWPVTLVRKESRKLRWLCNHSGLIVDSIYKGLCMPHRREKRSSNSKWKRLSLAVVRWRTRPQLAAVNTTGKDKQDKHTTDTTRPAATVDTKAWRPDHLHSQIKQ